MKKLNFDELYLSFKNCGIETGDLLLVHSSMGSIGYVQGGAKSVIAALLKLLGPEGTLVMPTMTSPFETFDAKTSPSNVGILTETLRKHPEAHRSLYPVHSVSAVGKQAKEICENHEKCSSGCGPGSPFYKLWQLGGKILLLGVDQDRSTIFHAFETENNAPYFMRFEIPAPTYAPYNGEGTFDLKDFPEGHRNFIGITSDLRSHGLIRHGRVGNALTQLMDAKKLHDFCLERLKEDPYYFLCLNPNCDFCSRARKGEKM